MSYWTYRIVKHKGKALGSDVSYFAIHEVYFNKKNKPCAMTKDPISLSGFDDEGDLIANLQMMIKDALKYPIFNPPKKWSKFS